MTPFEYLAVLISIVLGLGVTELLAGVQRLAHARDRVPVPYYLAAALVLPVRERKDGFDLRAH